MADGLDARARDAAMRMRGNGYIAPSRGKFGAAVYLGEDPTTGKKRYYWKTYATRKEAENHLAAMRSVKDAKPVEEKTAETGPDTTFRTLWPPASRAGRVRCPSCPYTAKAVWGIRQHSAHVHGIRLDKRLQPVGGIVRPKATPTRRTAGGDDQTMLACPKCGYEGNTIAAVRSHTIKEHGTKLLATRGVLRLATDADLKHECPTCHERFSGRNYLSRHLHMKHDVAPVPRNIQQRALRRRAKTEQQTFRSTIPVPTAVDGKPTTARDKKILSALDGVLVAQWEHGMYLVRIPKFGTVLGPRVTIQPIGMTEQGE